MRRHWHRWAGCLALMAASTLLLLLLAGRPSAQAPGQGSMPVPQAGPDDEISPQLLSGPGGRVFRLWRRDIPYEKGGGGELLAVPSSQDTWQTVLELLPKEPLATAGAVNVAFGTSKQIAVAYQWRTHVPRVKQIRLVRSDDGGQTWTRYSTAIEGTGKGFSPQVGWGRGQSLVVVWSDERRRGRAWDVYARRSPDGGATWEAEQLLSRFPKVVAQDVFIRATLLGDGQDRFWLVWYGYRNGHSGFYLNRSVDGGRTWTDPVLLTGQSVSAGGERLLRSGEHLLLVWDDLRTGKPRVYAATSDDGGVTWSSPTRVDHLPDNSPRYAAHADVVLNPDGEAVVVWQDSRNGREDIFVGRSRDWGRSWGPEDLRLDTDEAGTAVSVNPQIARADDGRLAVAWDDDRAGNEGIYLRVRSAGPSPVWGPEVLVGPPTPRKAARVPSVLWGRGGALYVAWTVFDFTGGLDAPTKRVDGRILFPDKN